MKAYVLTASWNYESTVVLGVYSSKQTAKDNLDIYLADRDAHRLGRHDDYGSVTCCYIGG